RHLAQRDDLGMGRGVLSQLALVVRAGNELAVAHKHRANRHVVVFQRTLGLMQGHVHEVVVAWEEASAHRPCPRSLRQCLGCRSAGTSSLLKQMPSPTASPTLRRALCSISIALTLCA